MNIFGLLATALICGTVCFVVWFIFKKPIHIVHSYINKVYTDEKPPVKEDKPTDKDVEIKNMDAVISAANALMGIGTDDGGND